MAAVSRAAFGAHSHSGGDPAVALVTLASPPATRLRPTEPGGCRPESLGVLRLGASSGSHVLPRPLAPLRFRRARGADPHSPLAAQEGHQDALQHAAASQDREGAHEPLFDHREPSSPASPLPRGRPGHLRRDAAGAFVERRELLGGSVPRTIALVIDQSLSMGYQSGDDTRLELAKRQAHAVIDDLKPGDAVALIAASDRANPLIAEPTVDHVAARKAIDGIQLLETRPISRRVCARRARRSRKRSAARSRSSSSPTTRRAAGSSTKPPCSMRRGRKPRRVSSSCARTICRRSMPR